MDNTGILDVGFAPVNSKRLIAVVKFFTLPLCTVCDSAARPTIPAAQ
jgi:hypothetical protein